MRAAAVGVMRHDARVPVGRFARYVGDQRAGASYPSNETIYPRDADTERSVRWGVAGIGLAVLTAVVGLVMWLAWSVANNEPWHQYDHDKADFTTLARWVTALFVGCAVASVAVLGRAWALNRRRKH